MSHLTRDPKVRSQEIAGLLSAGRGTSAALLGWIFLHLSRNPETYEKLRDAIEDAVGLKLDASLPDLSKLRSCEYLQNCISEALRL
ncbi:MAG: hypothetical protein Q9181_006750, partial [Wetmoreana brouardii]